MHSYSYRYVEFSVRNGILEDLDEHAVGPSIGTARIAGSTLQPPRSVRTKFTAEDDRALINWVHQIERDGGATSGNEIYKQLEAKVRMELLVIMFGGRLIYSYCRILGIHGSHGEIAG